MNLKSGLRVFTSRLPSRSYPSSSDHLQTHSGFSVTAENMGNNWDPNYAGNYGGQQGGYGGQQGGFGGGNQGGYGGQGGQQQGGW